MREPRRRRKEKMQRKKEALRKEDKLGKIITKINISYG